MEVFLFILLEGIEQLLQNPSTWIVPSIPGQAAFFDDTLVHGTTPLINTTEPRRIIACTYWRPGYKGRTEGFTNRRQAA
jgi:hypothetical protein